MTKTTSDYTGQKLELESDTYFNNTSVLTCALTLCLMLNWLYNHVFYKLITFSSFFHFLFCNWSLPHWTPLVYSQVKLRYRSVWRRKQHQFTPDCDTYNRESDTDLTVQCLKVDCNVKWLNIIYIFFKIL